MKFSSLSNQIKKALQIALLLATLFLNFGARGTQIAYAAPGNDNFASATLISSLLYVDSVDTTGATQQISDADSPDPEPVGPCTGTGDPAKQMNRGNNTVWYKYTTPSVPQTIAVDTIGSTVSGNPNDDLDTYIAVFTGSASSLSLVACNDDNNVGQTSQLSFGGSANTTYYFEVASFNCYYPASSCAGDEEQGGNLVFHAYITNTDVSIGGSPIGSYYVPSGGRVLPNYAGIQNGPVQVVSTTGTAIFTSQRSIYGPYSTFNEVMGYPDNQLHTKYWFTWYDDLAQKTWIMVGNPSSSQTAHVTIKIAGATMGPGIYDIAPGGRILPHYDGVQNGPVEISSDIPIFTSQRSMYGAASSFLEIMGYPDNRLHTKYWFTWYDDLAQKTWILVGNPSSSQTAHVTIKIAGATMGPGIYDIAPGGRILPNYTGVQNGPVEISSDIPIFTSQRSIFGAASNFLEIMGFPDNQLTDKYWFTWYDNVAQQTWILIGAP